jgi:predicted AAA+ superfamily ATPase
MDDPRGFLEQYDCSVLIDEIQRVPDLLSYLQTKLDQKKDHAQYILTGSQNFLLSKHIGQTLVGRTSLTTLLPLTLAEIREFNGNAALADTNSAILRGSYPGVYDNQLNPTTFYSSYISLYLERDVRDLRTIDNLAKFQRFLLLCAGRAGQILNMTDLGNSVGVDIKTIDAWLGVLEASFIAYRLQPYATNLPKRLTKMPKLYFYDTGILCYLLNIRTDTELIASHFYGSIFENLAMSELMKRQTNSGEQPRIYFIRDQYGEVDCLIETPSGLSLVEVKATSTFAPEHTNKLDYFGNLLGIAPARRFLVYNGATQQRHTVGLVNIFDVDSEIFS